MRIDHLVWYGADLGEQARNFGARLDAPPAYGGEHPGEGTANYVIALGSATYLEILGRDPAQDEGRLDAEIRGLSGAGLYHWAVSGVDLADTAERVRRAGLAGGELVAGGRRRPNGQWLAWTCYGLRDHGFGALVPFFIDWMDSEHPTASAPPGGSLAGFEVFSPRDRELREVFGVLGLDIKVSHRTEPGFAATLESQKGRHVLTSLSPVPRGYVI